MLADGETEHETIKCITRSTTSDNNLSKGHISEACFQCLCETVTECKPAICSDVPCGLYKISKGYWMDAGAPTLEGVLVKTENSWDDGDFA